MEPRGWLPASRRRCLSGRGCHRHPRARGGPWAGHPLFVYILVFPGGVGCLVPPLGRDTARSSVTGRPVGTALLASGIACFLCSRRGVLQALESSICGVRCVYGPTDARACNSAADRKLPAHRCQLTTRATPHTCLAIGPLRHSPLFAGTACGAAWSTPRLAGSPPDRINTAEPKGEIKRTHTSCDATERQLPPRQPNGQPQFPPSDACHRGGRLAPHRPGGWGRGLLTPLSPRTSY